MEALYLILSGLSLIEAPIILHAKGDFENTKFAVRSMTVGLILFWIGIGSIII